MPKSLVIVESNAKIKTISKFLGRDYQVLSSIGHVKDLPKQRLGVQIEGGFEPEYVTIRGKGKILTQLRKSASSADNIFIATDPDREGEAIAFHLAEVFKGHNGKIQRVLFNEITEKAVKHALQYPTSIDYNKVSAQKARRVVDRLVGYQVSPVLWRTVYRGLSAGRVQSVALRLICEREADIQVFDPQEYWSITADLEGKTTDPFQAKLHKINNQVPELTNEKETTGIVDDIRLQKFKVAKITKKTVTRNPAPPFTTSTMQQAAANRLGYTSKRIMMIAQQLYEGVELGAEGSVGLITYMRTDSTRIANEALEAVREYVIVSYGKEYLPAKARQFKVKSGAQDAHEAIRPTAMQREPRKIKRYLTDEQYKLYELIWNRFVASQMAAAKMNQTTIDIAAGSRYMFRATGTIIQFRGFLQVYSDFSESASDNDEQKLPDKIKENDALKLLGLKPQQHFTKPPARFTESSLIKELDALGIGRPSTYSTIISTIMSRKYVLKEKRQIVPTDLGQDVNRILIQNFPELFNVKFTAEMENNLDKIEAGDREFAQVTSEFYLPFSDALENANSRRQEIKDSLQEVTSQKCPECGNDLVIKWGRNGKFMACSGYPDCKHTQPLEEPEAVEDKCEKCGRNMIVKHGRFGRFLACSGYPECKNTQPFSTGVDCPNDGCGGVLVEKKSRKGKIFFGCSNYPECKFATWNKPVARACENCGNAHVELRSSQSRGEYLACPACKAQYRIEDKETADAGIVD